MSVKIANSETIINRILFEKLVDKSLPTLVVMVGIHGNEISGIFAVNNVIKKFEEIEAEFKANFYVIAGNLNSIAKGERFETVDLNRLWTKEQLDKIKSNNTTFNADEKEQIAVYKILKDILSDHTGNLYFVDLHTTSASTSPYLVFSDSVNNRLFSKNFPVPIIFGIEEYIKGPLLTYINEFGHIGVGFEAGRHDDENAVLINESFLWIALAETSCIDKDKIPNYINYIETLKKSSEFSNELFEIVAKHSIHKNEKFIMLSGFDNFQKIKKNQALATSNSQTLYSNFNGQIFMPLYQKQGDEGYFIIKKASKFWLFLSRFVRKHNLYSVFNFFPGLSFVDEEKYTITIKDQPLGKMKEYFIHLFGYRQKTIENGLIYYSRRDRKIKSFK